MWKKDPHPVTCGQPERSWLLQHWLWTVLSAWSPAAPSEQEGDGAGGPRSEFLKVSEICAFIVKSCDFFFKDWQLLPIKIEIKTKIRTKRNAPAGWTQSADCLPVVSGGDGFSHGPP